MSNIRFMNREAIKKQIEEELKELDVVDAISRQRRQELRDLEILLAESRVEEFERIYSRIGEKKNNG